MLSDGLLSEVRTVFALLEVGGVLDRIPPKRSSASRRPINIMLTQNVIASLIAFMIHRLLQNHFIRYFREAICCL